MKKLKTIILSTALLSTLNVFAQNSNNPPQGTYGAPMGVDMSGVLMAPVMGVGLIVSRIHTLQIGSKVLDMENDGVTSRRFVAYYSAEGALLYDHEVTDGSLLPDKGASRNAGVQAVPFQVNITEDKRIYITASAVGFRNMNTAASEDGLKNNEFNVIDNIDILKFEFNENYDYNNISKHTLRIVEIDAKLDTFDGEFNNQFLAIKAGAAPINYHVTKVRLITNEQITLDGFESAFKYGLEYNVELPKGWRLNLELMFKNSWSFGRGYRPTPEMERFYDDGTYSEEEYAKRMHERRSVFLVEPKMEISKQFKKEQNSTPLRLGIRMNGTFPIKDSIQGKYKTNINLLDQNPTIINGGIFLSF